MRAAFPEFRAAAGLRRARREISRVVAPQPNAAQVRRSRTAGIDAREILAARMKHEQHVDVRVQLGKNAGEPFDDRDARTARRIRKPGDRIEQPARSLRLRVRAKDVSQSPHARIVPARFCRGYFFGNGRAGLPATRSPGATSRVTTEPAPVSAPSPIETGATSDELEPMNTSLPMIVSFFFSPS